MLQTSSDPSEGSAEDLIRKVCTNFQVCLFYILFLSLWQCGVFGATRAFLSLWRVRTPLHCGARASLVAEHRLLGSWASVVAIPGLEHRLNKLWCLGLIAFEACGIFPNQGSNPCLLRWQAYSLLSYQRSLIFQCYVFSNFIFFLLHAHRCALFSVFFNFKYFLLLCLTDYLKL